MALVTVQIGQAGNQVGSEFFDAVMANSVGGPAEDRFFDTLSSSSSIPRARAVLVDMEPKVIASCHARARQGGRWVYGADRQVCEQRGAGNNWAHGYVGYGSRVSEDVLATVQAELESCDNFAGFLIPMSVAGGTGSGLGTRVTEVLRDAFPRSSILNQVIWPYSSGEVIVQNYNALLSLARLTDASDGIIVVENDGVHKVCQQMLRLKQVTFHDLNKEIAQTLAGVLQPVTQLGGSVVLQLSDVLERVCPHPALKLLSMCALPQMPDTFKDFTTYQWPGLLRTLRQMALTHGPCEEGLNWHVKLEQTGAAPGSAAVHRAVAHFLTLRGAGIGKDFALEGWSDARMYAAWAPSPLTVCVSPQRAHNHDMSASLLSNSQGVCGVAERTTQRAWGMFGARAYVHQYEEHGIGVDDFTEAFVKMETVLKAYREL